MPFLPRRIASDGSASLAGPSGSPNTTAQPHRDGKLTISSRVVVALAALLLSATYFFPLWEISLDAPQYPEGLGLEIWINQMQGQHPGDLNKINNLNHYIGMKQILPESIKELRIMPWIMRGVMFAGLIVAAFGRRSFLFIWLLIFVAVASAGFIDFYLWGYDYGHNLDTEHAIIKVPGMSYQPPVIGTKKLLNFEAASYPGVGGWVAIGAFLMAGVVWLREFRRSRAKAIKIGAATSTGALCLILFMAGCGQPKPAPIIYGTDLCDYCDMTIVDRAFGTELVTRKGKVLKFDSIECLAAVEVEGKIDTTQLHSRCLTDFANPDSLLNLNDAIVVATDRQKSPMGIGLVAVSDQQRASRLMADKGGRIVNWDETKRLVAETWKLAGAK
jgi:copper chaperone NosL